MSSRSATAQDERPVPGRKARGLLLVVSSPSGAGKTTLCNRLRDEFPNLGFSVSYTTRPPRPGETDGVEYNFVTQPTFQEMIARDEFAEYAMVHGNMYGTSAKRVGEVIETGRDLLFDIDYQGGRQLRHKFPEDVVLVFILPPSIRELERRLRGRGTDSNEVIERRVRVAREELRHYDEYDYLVMNDHIERAYDALRAVYLSQTHTRARLAALAEHVLSGQEQLL
ncbi:MAG: guanylate kinase [Myxococcales bacterium]|nr:guanylate kinase [Myxococcales bacterium]MCB9713702.1 guanylate kinase [Myxococcales bacterium]